MDDIEVVVGLGPLDASVAAAHLEGRPDLAAEVQQLAGGVAGLAAQHLPCEADHCRNLSIAETAQSVHPSGHPMSHSTHGGFNGPPTWLLNGGVFRSA